MMCEYTAAILPLIEYASLATDIGCAPRDKPRQRDPGLIEYASLATDVGGNDETYAPEECLGRLFGGVKL